MTEVPEEVRRLAAERDERRRAGDFAAADELRDRIAALGFALADSADGPTFEPVAPRTGAVPRIRPDDVASALELPASYDVTIHWIVEGWPEDVERGLSAFRRHAGDRSVQHVVVDVTGLPTGTFDADVEVVPLVDGAGWALARNAGLRRSLGRVVVVVDGSIEPAGDVLGPLERALDDPSVGVCGPFGIVTRDLREFEPSAGPDVDAIEGYLMAFRRQVLVDVAGFDRRFRWYRSADIELSFRIKERGLRAVAVPVPVERHEHRMWAAASVEERARWSKRNYNRFLDRFRGRFDLTVAGSSPVG